MAKRVRDPKNQRILENIANDELRHYHVWRTYTEQDVAPDKWRIWKYYWISRIFGFTLGIKLMEQGEESAQGKYGQLQETIAETEDIMIEENQHEAALIQLLDEERLRYTGSMVLGLNDALVELTGSITGIAAALSMGASEYLSTKAEETVKNPVKASIYTGGAYLVTVLLLILPYLVLSNYYLCLACTLAWAVLIIAFFNYYISVAKDEPFRRRFLEMTCLSLGVATFSFLAGLLLRTFLGIDI